MKTSSTKGSTGGGELKQALAILDRAQKIWSGLEAERARLHARIEEIDAVLGKLPRPSGSQAAPKRPGRPLKNVTAPVAAAAKTARGRAANGKRGKTVREVVLSALGKEKPLAWSTILDKVMAERPDVSKASVGPIVAKLREAGLVKVTGPARDYRYTLGG